MGLCVGVINQLLTWMRTKVLYVNQDTTNNKRIEMAYIDYGKIASCKRNHDLNQINTNLWIFWLVPSPFFLANEIPVSWFFDPPFLSGTPVFMLNACPLLRQVAWIITPRLFRECHVALRH